MVLSFLERFLKFTTTLESVIDVKFGCSPKYDKVVADPNGALKAPEVVPNPPPKLPVGAALLLLAWDLNCRLLIVSESSDELVWKSRPTDCGALGYKF